MGQGLNTKVLQVASHVLNLPMSKFVIKPSNTLNNANDVGTVASVTSDISSLFDKNFLFESLIFETFFAGFVVKNCCDMLNERLKPFREEFPEASWEEIVDKAFKKDVDLSATFMYKGEFVSQFASKFLNSPQKI